jgi:hypothetical protein
MIPQPTAALSYYEGELVHRPGNEFAPDISYWEGLTPLGELRIPLSQFEGINLEAITEISLVFDQTSRGAIMLSNIVLEN